MVHKPVSSSRITATPPHVTILLNNFKTLSLALLAVFLLSACKKDPVVGASPESGKVERTNGRNRVPSFDLLSSRSAGTISADLAEWFEAYISFHYPDYDTAILEIIDPAWEVLDGPNLSLHLVEHGGVIQLGIPTNHFLMGHIGTSRLVFRQEGNGELEVYLLALLPDEDYFAAATDPDLYVQNFTGFLSLIDLTFGQIGGLSYQQGIPTEGYYHSPDSSSNFNGGIVDDRCPGCTWYNLFPNTPLDGTGGGGAVDDTRIGTNYVPSSGWWDNFGFTFDDDGTLVIIYDNENGSNFGSNIPEIITNIHNGNNTNGIGGYMGNNSGSGSGNDTNTNTGPTSTIYDETVFNIYRTALIGLGYGESEATQITDDCIHHLPNETAFYNCVDDHNGTTNPDPEPTGDDALVDAVNTFLEDHDIDLTKLEKIALNASVAKNCDENTGSLDACIAAAFFGLTEHLGEDDFESVLTATQLLSDIEQAGLINGPYDEDFEAILEEKNINTIAFTIAVSFEMASLKLEHPDWSDWKISLYAYSNVLLEGLHLTLDIIGLVPGAGEVCDLVNGGIYTLEGEYLEASLSFASMIPVAGWFSTSTKWAVKAIPGSRIKLVWIRDGAQVTFASNSALRSQLRRILKTPSGEQAHHLIPLEHVTSNSHPVIQSAAKGFGNSAWHPNELANGINLPLARHNGNHNLYNARVKARLDQINSEHGNNISAQDAITELDLLMDEIRTLMNNNPNTHINDLIF